ncbi:hypothetical protein F2P81_019511 [Scophthalmus maximus]|uniref:Uncharacterized protein n=1 Tax=Scophthalmus maximus TaxID=52904 RepID=A0A6A4SC52_SCOMX|nr:hypothetical protein F2P81_019511 [Scophthalmus maximus]
MRCEICLDVENIFKLKKGQSSKAVIPRTSRRETRGPPAGPLEVFTLRNPAASREIGSKCALSLSLYPPRRVASRVDVTRRNLSTPLPLSSNEEACGTRRRITNYYKSRLTEQVCIVGGGGDALGRCINQRQRQIRVQRLIKSRILTHASSVSLRLARKTELCAEFPEVCVCGPSHTGGLNERASEITILIWKMAIEEN